MDNKTQVSNTPVVNVAAVAAFEETEPSGEMTNIDITDKMILEYLVAEGGKTKAEWITEIQERFYTYEDYKAFLEKAR
jgi:hypothetical protein